MWMSKTDHEKFDRQLLADDPKTTSRGTTALMAAMGVRVGAPPPPETEG